MQGTIAKICPKRAIQADSSESDKSLSCRVQISTRISDYEVIWDDINSSGDMLFSSRYLSIIEKNPPEGIMPYYAILFENAIPVGCFYFQYKYVRLQDNLRDVNYSQNDGQNPLLQFLKTQCIKAINFPTLVCGNLMITGSYGYRFKEGVKKEKQKQHLAYVTDYMMGYLKSQNIHPGLIVIKDFEGIPQKNEFKLKNFTDFSVQPNMYLSIKPEWTTFEEYLFDLKSKYRVRYRKSMQTTQHLTQREMSLEEIKSHRQTIHHLYKNISDQARFNSFVLDVHYFEALKEALGKKMRLISYWQEETLVGFYTTIEHEGMLEAHFLGYDTELNKTVHLYLAMLYDMLKMAIRLKCAKLNMSRTAIEIKSTVGAIPEDMYVQIRHTNKVINKSVESIVKWVNPSEDYIIRHPFK